jgi:aryl-alcohol dehydrogenase-like predicted oxidoreductase
MASASMSYVYLGRTGLKVSRLCLGCMSYGDPGWRPWILDEEASRPHFRKAFDLGINFFDTADMYSRGKSEEVTGRMLRDLASRHDYVLATKVFFPAEGKGPNRSGLSRKHILEACDASLRRLGTDFIDLYQVHRWDPYTPFEETLSALDSLLRSGKVRYLGASSMAAWQFARALSTSDRHGWERFVSMQNHYNLVYREEEREMIPLCIQEGVGLVPWSPLARGFLSGSRKRGEATDTARARSDEFAEKLYFQSEDFDVLDAVLAVASARGLPPARVALAWLLSRPGVVAPIIGATKLPHLDDAAAALEVTLSEDEVKQLEAPYKPHPVLGHEQPTPRDALRV